MNERERKERARKKNEIGKKTRKINLTNDNKRERRNPLSPPRLRSVFVFFLLVYNYVFFIWGLCFGGEVNGCVKQERKRETREEKNKARATKRKKKEKSESPVDVSSRLHIFVFFFSFSLSRALPLAERGKKNISAFVSFPSSSRHSDLIPL